jgi:phosphoribosyl 1,2-cyclic phosphodiesterase
MELSILGSSSAGNCYVFHNENEALIVECGVRFIEAKKAINFNVSKVVGCLITHEHGDHCKYVNDVLDAVVPVYASAGTIEAMKPKIKGSRMPDAIKLGSITEIGNFKVLAFRTKHDCADPVGFLILHREMGVTLFATDTYYLQNKFDGLNNILIECNYRMDILQANVDAGKIPAALLNRTLQSHMSFDTCLSALMANDLTQVNNIVLIHLSDGNSNAHEFKQAVTSATGKSVHIASPGMKIKFNKTPF